MPRPARVQYEVIFNVLKDLPIFTENGDLKKQKDPVWKEACKIIPEMNLKNLYVFVYQDRKQIKTNLMKHLNIVCRTPAKKLKIQKREPVEKYDNIWDEYDYYETLDNNDQESILNDLSNLITMRGNEEYKNSIHKIGLLPFTVNYWHPEQVSLWSELINLESSVSFIVLDKVVANFVGNLESGNIFLYALAVKLENSIILLAQMMSDSVDTVEIEYFLNTWLRSKAPAPTELVLGYSYSLLDASSLAFNFCSFNDYNIRCYQYLTSELAVLPPTLLYIDIIGLIKVVDGWGCFENVLQPVKDLYLCSIMYLSTVDSIEDFKETVITVLALCQSPFQSEETESRRKALWEFLTTETIQQMNQQYIQFVTGKHGSKSYSFLDIRQTPTVDETPHLIYDFINQLNLQAFEICDFNVETDKIANEYYCPIILDNFIHLLSEFPAWTKIIVRKNECSTLVSSCATKHLATLTELKEPMSPPQFLTYHFDKIKTYTHRAQNLINCIKNKNKLYIKERKNNHAHLTSINPEDAIQIDNRIEIVEPSEENDVIENEELDLASVKDSIQLVLHSLLDFDEYINNTLETQVKEGQEIKVCKILFDCCTEMKSFEKYLGLIAERFCLTNDNFVESFKQIFADCYNTIELLDKNELKNSSKLFAHLLYTECITWDILSILKLNEKVTTTAKKNFIRILLRELSENMGIVRLQEKLKAERHMFKGLFPSYTSKDGAYAALFYKSIGLKGLSNILKDTTSKSTEESSNLKRTSSNSSIASTSSSCDFVIELRVSKKNKKISQNEKKKVFVIK